MLQISMSMDAAVSIATLFVSVHAPMVCGVAECAWVLYCSNPVLSNTHQL